MALSFSNITLKTGQIQIQNITPNVDPFWNNVTLLLNFDGELNGSTNFVDLSNSNHSIIARGNSHIDTNTFKYGTGSVSFDGVDDCLEVAYNTDFVFGSGDFTIECWVNVISYPATGIIGFLERDFTGTRSWALEYSIPDNSLRFRAERSSGGGGTPAAATIVLPTNQWFHVAGVRQGATISLFYNGTKLAEAGVSGSLYNAPGVPVRIGSIGVPSGATSVSGEFPGWMDDVRITKGVARYTTDFDPQPHGTGS